MPPRNADLHQLTATVDSCEARIPSAAEHQSGEVPTWCELVLTIERDEHALAHHFRRSDGELIIEVLNEVLHPTHGTSIVEHVWRKLDAAMENIMEGNPTASDRSYALGLAEAIALITNPYNPDIDAVRNRAKARYLGD